MIEIGEKWFVGIVKVTEWSRIVQHNTSNQKRSTIIIVAILALAMSGIIVYSIVQLFLRAGKSKILVQYAPFISKVELGETILKNNAVNYIKPGDYTIKVSLDGFETLTTNVTVTEDSKNLFGQLTPNSPKGEELAQKYQQDFQILDPLYSASLIESGDQARKQWPIISELPINNMLFTIGYKTNDQNFQVIIDTTSTYMGDAISKVKSLDYSEKPLESYDIAFQGWVNPLVEAFIPNQQGDPLDFIRDGYKHLDNDLDLNVSTGSYVEYDNKTYYYTTMTTGLESHYNLVTYKCLLRKSTTWELVSTPTPILTTYNTPNTPLEVLAEANNN